MKKSTIVLALAMVSAFTTGVLYELSKYLEIQEKKDEIFSDICEALTGGN